MKRSVLITLAILFAVGTWSQEIMARGFGGGGYRGGGGGYGGYRGGSAAYRSPSMSRPSFERSSSYSPSRQVSRQAYPKQQITSRPAPGRDLGRGGVGQLDRQAMGRPTKGELQQFLNLPQNQRPSRGSDLAKIGTGALAGALGAEGARKLLEAQKPGGLERPSQLPEKGGLADRRGEAGRPSNLPARQVSNQIRDNWQQKHDKPFNPQWWKDHPNAAKHYWDQHHHHPWNYWWRWATWGAVAGWTAGAASASAYGDPVYYDYGQNIYYEGDNVYVGGTETATAQEYYQQASALAEKAPETTSQEADDWLPLGVFALSKGNVADSNMVLQLAINKEGVISGMYYNTKTDIGRPVKGTVDKKSQRAAWTFADGNNTDIIMETGIYNLTQDQTEALVHFGKDKTQQWLMVRLKQPEEEQQAEKKAEDS
jgi:hypothetical protein